MLYAFCGLENGYNMGNLKSCTMTLFILLDWKNGRDIYSNYGLKIPHEKIHSIKNLMAQMDDLEDVTIGLDELSVWFDNYVRPSTKNGTSLLKNFARQSRKRNVKLYYTAQTFGDINKSLRKITNNIYITKKLHLDYTECFDDECHEPHQVELTKVRAVGYEEYQIVHEPIYIKIPDFIFDLYDTNELIDIMG